MLKLLTDLTDLIFPPRVTEQALRNCKAKDTDTIFKPRNIAGITALSDYQNPLVKAAIVENKFHNHKAAATLLNAILTKWVDTQETEVVFVPVPLGKKRLRDRGYNQVERVLTTGKQLPYTNLIVRKHDTKPQSELPKSQRLVNVKDAFVTKPVPNLPNNCKIVILDDVVTTGSTLRECKKALTGQNLNNSQIHCLAIAH